MKFSLAVFLLASTFAVTNAFADVSDTATERRFFIPAGGPGLVMPRGDWAINKEQRREDGKVAYYMMYSEQAKTVFSVYIDQTGPCKSADECLKAALKNPMYKDALELKTFDHQQFKAAYFYLDKPQGLAVYQTHLLVSAYVDGLWFDIHVSQTSSKTRPEVGPMLELVQSLQLK